MKLQAKAATKFSKQLLELELCWGSDPRQEVTQRALEMLIRKARELKPWYAETLRQLARVSSPDASAAAEVTQFGLHHINAIQQDLRNLQLNVNTVRSTPPPLSVLSTGDAAVAAVAAVSSPYGLGPRGGLLPASPGNPSRQPYIILTSSPSSSYSPNALTAAAATAAAQAAQAGYPHLAHSAAHTAALGLPPPFPPGTSPQQAAVAAAALMSRPLFSGLPFDPRLFPGYPGAVPTTFAAPPSPSSGLHAPPGLDAADEADEIYVPPVPPVPILPPWLSPPPPPGAAAAAAAGRPSPTEMLRAVGRGSSAPGSAATPSGGSGHGQKVTSMYELEYALTQKAAATRHASALEDAVAVALAGAAAAAATAYDAWPPATASPQSARHFHEMMMHGGLPPGFGPSTMAPPVPFGVMGTVLPSAPLTAPPPPGIGASPPEFFREPAGEALAAPAAAPHAGAPIVPLLHRHVARLRCGLGSDDLEVGIFVRDVSKLPMNAKIMRTSDKDYIVKIQQSQLAAIGGLRVFEHVATARGAMLPHGSGALAGRPLDDVTDVGSGPKADALPHTPLASEAPSSAASLAAKLKAIVAGRCAAAHFQGEVAADDAPLHFGSRPDRQLRARPRGLGGEPHVNRTTDVVPSAAEQEDVSLCGSEALHDKVVTRRLQLATEGAFEELLELERLSARLAATPAEPSASPRAAGLRQSMLSEVRRLGDSLAGRFHIGGAALPAPEGGAGEAVPGTPRSSARAVEIFGLPFLEHLLACRKGCVLLRRLLDAFGEQLDGAGEVRTSTHWALMCVLLGASEELCPAAGDGAPEAEARLRLRQALARQLSRALRQLDGSAEASSAFADLTSALLGDGRLRDRIAALCTTHSGMLLLQKLLERGRAAGADLVPLEAELCEEASRRLAAGTAASAAGGAEVPPGLACCAVDVDRVLEVDLLEVLILAASIATPEQCLRVQGAVDRLADDTGGWVSLQL